MKLLLVFQLLVYFIGSGASQRSNLTLIMMTSFGQFGFNSSGLIPAADMALEDINENSQILPGYNLVYNTLRDTQCHRVKALDEFFEAIQSEPVKIAAVGCGCSIATEPVAEISHHWNISLVSYASVSTTLLNRTRFRRYFRNSLTFVLLLPTLRIIMKRYNWTRIGVLTLDENLFTGAEVGIRSVLKQSNITVESRTFQTGKDPTNTVDDLFIESQDYRVFFLNTYSRPARFIICEAYKRGYMYPRYAWMTFDWYPQAWWTQEVSQDIIDCTDKELESFLDKMITLRRHPTQEDVNATTNTGISQQRFADEFRQRAGPSQDIAYGGVLYDVIWAVAIALNETMSMVEAGSSSIEGTGCEDKSGSLVPLENFTYNNEMMGCLIQGNLQRTNFSGVSGHVVFDGTGTRIYPIVRIKQYHNDGNELRKENIAFIEQLPNGSLSFRFIDGIDDNFIYPS